MENYSFQIKTNTNDKIVDLKVSGNLTLENAQKLKKEFVGVLPDLNDFVSITITEAIEIDLSFIQLLVAFLRQLEKLEFECKILMNLSDEQKSLWENVGFKNELFMIK